MKSSELKINDDTLIKTLNDDALERNEKIFKFIKFIDALEGNTIVSVDGEWGSGKSFFVKQSDFIINNASSMESKINNKSQQCEFKKICETVQNSAISSVYFNAWEHDDEDPILSLLSALIAYHPEGSNMSEILKNIKFDEIIKVLLKNSPLHIDVDILGSSNETILKSIKEKIQLKAMIKEAVEQLIAEKSNKVVLFIDELDRCNPIYSVKMLERIKHYFTNERLVIVLSTNIDELEKTISNVYGYQETSVDYLDKFIDFKLYLPQFEKKKYAEYVFQELQTMGSTWYKEVLISNVLFHSMSLRNINRYMDYMKLFKKALVPDFSQIRLHEENKVESLIKYVIVPYMIALMITNPKEFYNLKRGNGKDRLFEFLKMDDINNIMIDSMKLYPGKLTDDILQECINSLCCVFDKSCNYNEMVTIAGGKHRVNELKKVAELFNILEALTDFEA